MRFRLIYSAAEVNHTVIISTDRVKTTERTTTVLPRDTTTVTHFANVCGKFLILVFRFYARVLRIIKRRNDNRRECILL